jgi:hypothetical protein
MSEALVSDRPAESGRVSIAQRKQELGRTVDAKLAQGYRLESRSDTRAVLQMGKRRRWFGLFRGAQLSYDIAVDEFGHASSRRRG